MSDAALFEVEKPPARGDAIFSPCERYRYVLGRRWRPGPFVTFLMLNPSTATAEKNDPTITRCENFAGDWGYAGIHVLNVYALRSTDPRGLWQVDDPVGPENDHHIAGHLRIAKDMRSPIVAAWGVNAKPERVEQILALPGADALRCLGKTKAGAPRHPLYVRGDTRPQPWP